MSTLFICPLKTRLLILSLFLGLSTMAQTPTLIINGKVEKEKDELGNVKCTLTEKQGGKVVDQLLTTKNGKFTFEMPYEKVFVLSFSKEGYATKKLEINTQEVPKEDGEYGFEWPKMEIEMLEYYEDVDYSILEDPVGKIYYNALIVNFDNDRQYARSLSDPMKRLEVAVEAARRRDMIREETLEDDFKMAIRDGDLFLEEEDFENALIQYEAALDLKPSASYPKEQVEKVTELINANRSVEERYAMLLTRADNAFASEAWDQAKTFYTDALKLKTNEQYPNDQLVIVEQKIAEALLLAEQKRQAALDAERAEKAYFEAINKADKAFEVANYDDAKLYYSEALEWRPEEFKPKNKLEEIEGILAAIEAKYNELITTADNAFTASSYADAITNYEAALKVKRGQEYPISRIDQAKTLMADADAVDKQYQKMIAAADRKRDEQELKTALTVYQNASNLKPEETYPKAQIAAINTKLDALAAAQAEQARIEAERIAALKAKFDAMIAQADVQFTSKDWKAAIASYQTALDLMPEENYPVLQINKAEQELKLLASREENYQAALTKANNLRDLNNYAGAKKAYEEALTYGPDESYPKEQLALMNTKLAELAAAETARKKAEMERLAALQAKYDAAIAEADKLLEAKSFVEAKAKFNAAKELKPEESYPIQKLNQIAALIASEEAARLAAEQAKAERAEKLAAFNQQIKQADSFFEEGNWEAAKKKYLDALELLPNEAKPKERIAEIDTKLAELAAAEQAKAEAEAEKKRIQNLYAQAIAKGDEAFQNKSLDIAEESYLVAQNLKTEEVYPNEQLDKIKAERERLVAEAERKRIEEEERQQKLIAYNAIIEKADNAFKKESYEEAQTQYQEALAIFPEESKPKSQLNRINGILEEQARVAAENAKNDTEFNYELAKKFSQGKTEKTFKEGNKTVTQIVIVKGNRGDEYRKEVYSWGQKFYLKNGKPYNQVNWEKETK